MGGEKDGLTRGERIHPDVCEVVVWGKIHPCYGAHHAQHHRLLGGAVRKVRRQVGARARAAVVIRVRVLHSGRISIRAQYTNTLLVTISTTQADLEN